VVRQWLSRLGVSKDTQQDLVLAVSEAAANAVEHAYPSEPRAYAMVELSLWAERHVLCLEIVDHGTWRPPVANPPAQRGRGIELMRKLVDAVAIRQGATGTTVLLQHLLPNNGDVSVAGQR
jgi:anti-sigma regulatory factor (Ser/Thr protein kinase)